MADVVFNTYQQRIVAACEAVLNREGSVGLVELCQQMQFLHFTHVETWKRGRTAALSSGIQVGPKKLLLVIETLETWATQKGLKNVQVPYTRQGLHGSEPLKIYASDDEQAEALWHQRWIPSDLSAKKAEKLEQKLKKVEDLVVFSQAHDEQTCTECQAVTCRGELFFLDVDRPICLSCADMDHLEFLPSGDATLTRRARKFSSLTAQVLQFNRRRKHYERIGLLVTPESIDQAEASMDEDASDRAVQRQKAAAARVKEDAKLVASMTALILTDFPKCPAKEAQQIAEHTAVRGSGRVGRSEAGRSLATNAIELAVIAWIRHQHTNYDSLLMRGVARQDARDQIRAGVQKKLEQWRG